MEEAVDDDGRPAEEEGHRDGGHQDVGQPATLVRSLVLAGRSEKNEIITQVFYLE